MILPKGCLSYTGIDQVFTIAASVPTGLEPQCLDEITEKICDKNNAWTAQGRVFFNIKLEKFNEIHNLRTVDNLFLLVKEFSNYNFNPNRDKAVEDIMQLPKQIQWDKIEEFWMENLKYAKKISPHRANKRDTTGSKIEIEKTFENIRFRVSANRVGKSQSITSVDAEQKFGGALQDITQWKVDLTNYNLEVFVNLALTSVQVYLALTLESLHRRNIVCFGQTTLRATIASCMLRMCSIIPGELVIDPMCGTGAIPVEGSVSDKTAYYVAGDLYKKPLLKTRDNIYSNRINNRFELKCDRVQWDVTNLPLKPDSVDVFVSDMPFGKRVGTKADNRILYPKTLKELARVCRKEMGRACLLSYASKSAHFIHNNPNFLQDKNTMRKSLQMHADVWKVRSQTFINIGGLKAGVFLLIRTDT